MTTVNHTTVVGVFQDRDAARAAVNELRRLGFPEGEIGVIAPENQAGLVTGETSTGTTEKSKWEEGAATGVAAGAGIGALWALGIVAGVLPAIGPAVAGGILASVVASAAGGAAIAGVVGALIGLGIPEHEARFYEGELTSGRTLVTVRAPGRYEEAEEVLRRHGGYDIHSSQTASGAGVVDPTFES
jgi:hypothetical protein